MDIAVAHLNSPFVTAYPWSAGFGTKYSNPGTLPGGTGWDINFSPSGNDLAVGHDFGSLITVYPRSSGFGTKYSNPGTAVPQSVNNWSRGVAFSRSGNDIIAGGYGTPYFRAYPRTSGTGFGTAYSDAGNLPTGNLLPTRMSFSANDVAIAFTGFPIPISGATTMRVYPFTSGTGFGTKYTDAATLGGSDGQVATFSPSGNDIVWGWLSGTNLRAYPRSAGFGTAYTNPTATSGSITHAKFSSNGNDLFLISDSSPFVHAYPRSAGFGTKYSDPGTAVAGGANTRGLAYSDTNDVAVGSTDTPRIQVYPRSSGFGSKYTDPGTLPAGTGRGVAFTPLPVTPAVANFFMFMT